MTKCYVVNIGNNNSWSGLAIYDGTKLVTFGPLSAGGAYTINYDRWTNVTTNNTDTAQGGSSSWGGRLQWNYLKITNDGLNLTFYWSIDGASWLQIKQEPANAYLASTGNVGLYSTCSAGTQSQIACGFEFFRSTP